MAKISEFSKNNNRSREKKLLKNSVILAIGTVLPRLASVITLPVVTAGLTKEEYGTYDLILVLVSLLLPAVTLQIHVAAFRFIIDVLEQKEECKKIISSIYAVIFPLSIIALIVLYFLLPGTDSITKILICFYMLIDIIVVSFQWIVRGLGKNHFYSISAIINSIARMVSCVLFISILNKGLRGVIISQILANVITLLYLLLFGNLVQYISLKSISIDQIKSMISYSWPLVPNDLSMWVMRMSDRLVITSFMGIEANAIYAVANKIPQLLSVAQSVFTKAWQESASLSSNDDDVDVYYSSMFDMVYKFVAGVLGVLIACTPLIFKLLVRGDYGEAYFQMPILFMAMFFNTITSYLGGIYVACKSTKNIAVTTIIAAICNIVVDLALINLIGLYAASISTLVSYAVLAVYRMNDVKKLVNIKYDVNFMVEAIIFLTIELFLCYLQKSIPNLINIFLGFGLFIYLNKDIIMMLWKNVNSK